MVTVDIYSYFNYREYLRDFLAQKKQENPHYSHRLLLGKMGITSSGFLANVISGKSCFTIDQASKFASVTGLGKKETRYFKNMVYFMKAKTLAEKNDFFQQLISYRKSKIKFLQESQLGLFEKWYYVVIRELLNFFPFTDDYGSLAAMLDPPILPGEAKTAIVNLEKMGYIKKDAAGLYKQNDAAISTGDEVSSLLVANYQKYMFELGMRSLESFKKTERDLSGVLLTVSDDTFMLIKEEIQNFRKRLLQIAVDDENPDRVIRCNFQIFPVTKRAVGNEQ